MDFIDWCSQVLSVLLEESSKSVHVQSSGLDDVRLFNALFGEEADWDTPARGAMDDALEALEDVNLIETRNGHFRKVTLLGRQLGSDLKLLWQEICSIPLDSDLERILSAVNKLSQKNSDNYAWLEDIHHTTLLPELGDTGPFELGEGGMMDTLWSRSEDLAQMGFVERDERAGPHLNLTSTYRGLVWGTRRRLFQKCDVFISHITEEREAAIRLKDLLVAAFGNDLKIFISSDYRSIPGGKVWYAEIIENLTASPVVLALLSTTSVSRPWINFEAGVGIGSGSLVIPLVAADLPKSGVGFPLAALQIRSINDPKDVEGMLHDIGGLIGRTIANVDAAAFVAEDSAAGGAKLEVSLHQVTEKAYNQYEDHRLRLNLINNTSKTINDFRLDVEVPNAFLNQSTGYSAEVADRRTAAHRVFRVESKDSSIKTLHPGDIAKSFFSITLVVPPGVAESNSLEQKIIIKVFAGDTMTQKIEKTIREILEMPPSFG